LKAALTPALPSCRSTLQDAAHRFKVRGFSLRFLRMGVLDATPHHEPHSSSRLQREAATESDTLPAG